MGRTVGNGNERGVKDGPDDVKLPMEGLNVDGGNLDDHDCVLASAISFDAAISC